MLKAFIHYKTDDFYIFGFIICRINFMSSSYCFEQKKKGLFLLVLNLIQKGTKHISNKTCFYRSI